jgi:hypothetical protein
MTGAMAVETQKERCGRCGKMSPVTAAFCPRCGVRLRDVSPVLQAEVLDAEPVTDQWQVIPDRATPPPIPAIPLNRPRSTLGYAGPQPPPSPLTLRGPQRAQPTRRKAWPLILIVIFVLRGFASYSSHSRTTTPTPTRSPKPAKVQPTRPPPLRIAR